MSGTQKLILCAVSTLLGLVLAWVVTLLLGIDGRIQVMEVRLSAAASDRYTGRQAHADLALRDQRIEALTADMARLHTDCRRTP